MYGKWCFSGIFRDKKKILYDFVRCRMSTKSHAEYIPKINYRTLISRNEYKTA